MDYKLITDFFTKEYLLGLPHCSIIITSLIIAIIVIRFFWNQKTFNSNFVRLLAGAVGNTVIAFIIKYFNENFAISAIEIFIATIFWYTIWFVLLILFLAALKTLGAKYNYFKNLFLLLTIGVERDTGDKKHADSKIKLLWYCKKRYNILLETNFNVSEKSEKEEIFQRSFELLGIILLNGFFQHDPSIFHDYHLAFYTYDSETDCMVYDYGIDDHHYGDTPSRKPKGKDSAVYRAYKENQIIRYPHQIKKSALKPPLKRDIKAFVCVPVRKDFNSQPIGAIVLDSRKRKDQFNESENMKIHLELLIDFSEFLSCLCEKLELL